MKIGSLFSGIGGLELGLERAGLGPVVWQVEIDPFCRSVLEKHWPDAERFEDVCKIETLPHVDIICGGFPCQDISTANTANERLGLNGSKSGLWSEFARIIRLARPRFVVVENVAALLGRGVGDVLSDLASCGYDAIWDCVPASSIGAPHQRDRLFIVAHSNDNGEPGLRKHGKTSGLSTFSPHVREWEDPPKNLRVDDGVSSDMDRTRLKALGNAVVPKVAEVIGAVIKEIDATSTP